MKISSVTSVTPKSMVLVGVPKIIKSCYFHTERCLAWRVVADATSKVVLFSVYNYSGVPNAINLLADHLARELSCHTVRQIVDVKFDRERSHYFG